MIFYSPQISRCETRPSRIICFRGKGWDGCQRPRAFSNSHDDLYKLVVVFVVTQFLLYRIVEQNLFRERTVVGGQVSEWVKGREASLTYFLCYCVGRCITKDTLIGFQKRPVLIYRYTTEPNWNGRHKTRIKRVLIIIIFHMEMCSWPTIRTVL